MLYLTSAFLSDSEMAHCIGFGDTDMLVAANKCDSSLPYNVYTGGKSAVKEWAAVSGCSYAPPVQSQQCGHWHEDCLRKELMTPFFDLNADAESPLSRITIAALEDFGYTVDYTEADSFTVYDLDPGCNCLEVHPFPSPPFPFPPFSFEAFMIEALDQCPAPPPIPWERKVSEASIQAAVAFGKAELDKRRERKREMKHSIDQNSFDELEYADDFISVFVKDNEHDVLFSVVVRQL